MDKNTSAIFANLISDWKDRAAELDVLTFIEIDPSGEYIESIRTYQDLWDNGQRLAMAMEQSGMLMGSKFALLMQNHPEFVDAMVASSILGTVMIPIDPRTRGEKLTFMLRHADCEGVICADYTLANVLAVIGQLPQIRWIWVVNSNAEYELIESESCELHYLNDILPQTVPELPVKVDDPDSPMQMLYTSGTTGDPKATLCSYNRYSGVANLNNVIGLQEGDRPYTGLSLTHGNAQLITLGNCLANGYRGVISRKFTKTKLWDITRCYGCTTFNLLGGMTTAIFSNPESNDDADNPVRYVLSAGMPAALWQAFSERFNVDIFEFYAAVEGGLTLNPPGQGPVGSIGKPPASMQARIVRDDDTDCETGESGELIFRNADGSCPVVNYYKNPEAGQEKTANGWLHSGDICHRDEQDWIYFDYRKGTSIRRNGEFVDPAQVEKLIASHATVDDVFVYGVLSDSGAPGEKNVVAAVVPVDHQDFDVTAIFSYCRKNLEPNFVPTYLQVLEQIPKTASEKPQERLCLELLQSQQETVFTKQA